MLIIAVASKSGTTIDEHFGRAKLFRVYEVDDDGSFRFLENREIPSPRSDSCEPSRDVGAVVKLLERVDAVFALRVGPNSSKALAAAGIRSFSLNGPVEKALSSYGRRHRLLDAHIPGVSSGCGGGGGGGCGCSSRGGCG